MMIEAEEFNTIDMGREMGRDTLSHDGNVKSYVREF
jgi:hypothetical protein